jgi:hypothetical protein
MQINKLRHHILLRTTNLGGNPMQMRFQILRPLPIGNAQTLSLRPSGSLVQQITERRDKLPTDLGWLHKMREMPGQHLQKWGLQFHALFTMPGRILLEMFDHVERPPIWSLYLQQSSGYPIGPNHRRIRSAKIWVLLKQVQNQREVVNAVEVVHRQNYLDSGRVQGEV